MKINQLVQFKCKDEHIQQLKNFYENTKDDTIIDLLPWLRELTRDEDAQLFDQLIQYDFQVEIFENKTKLNCQSWNEGDLIMNKQRSKNPCIRNYEPDYVQFIINFSKEWNKRPKKINFKEVLIYCMGIMLSDCTDCYDALDYINMTQDGIIAYGNVSMTYHS